MRGRSCLCVLLLTAIPALSAQAPADRWPQFRGSPALPGTSAAVVPDQLRVLWTYEAGEAIDPPRRSSTVSSTSAPSRGNCMR